MGPCERFISGAPVRASVPSHLRRVLEFIVFVRLSMQAGKKTTGQVSHDESHIGGGARVAVGGSGSGASEEKRSLLATDSDAP